MHSDIPETDTAPRCQWTARGVFFSLTITKLRNSQHHNPTPSKIENGKSPCALGYSQLENCPHVRHSPEKGNPVLGA
jgi:hypothetical protein